MSELVDRLASLRLDIFALRNEEVLEEEDEDDDDDDEYSDYSEDEGDVEEEEDEESATSAVEALLEGQEDQEDLFLELAGLLEDCHKDWDVDNLALAPSSALLVSTFARMDEDSDRDDADYSRVWEGVMNLVAGVGGVVVACRIYRQALEQLGLDHATYDAVLVYDDDSAQDKLLKKVVRDLLAFFVMGSDISPHFRQSLADEGMLQDLAGLMLWLLDQARDSEEHFSHYGDVVTIFYNCSRSDDLWLACRDVTVDERGIVDILCQILDNIDDLDLRLVVLLTLSYLADEEAPDEVSVLAADAELDTILEQTWNAWHNENHRSDAGMAVAELLQGVFNLAKLESSSKMLVQKGILQTIAGLLETQDDYCKEYLCLIVWKLAWNHENAAYIRGYEQLMTMLYAMAQHPSRQIASSAEGALFVINMEQEVQVTEAEGAEERPGGHVMISAHVQDKKLVDKIVKGLKKKKFAVEISMENVEWLNDETKSLIDEAAVVIIAMSSAYRRTDSCRAEATYIGQQRKVMVPIRMEKLTTLGWMDTMVGDKKLIDFYKSSHIDKHMPKLLKAIGKRGRQ